MSSFFTILLIGISLSMDAFSLSLVYGMIGMSRNKKVFLSLIVGLYHFIMPLIGLTFGSIIDDINIISIDIIASIILIYIGIDLIISNFKKEANLGLTLGNIIGNKIGLYSKTIGGIVLIVIAIILFIN